MKKKVDSDTNNNDRANLKTNEGCNNSKCNKIKTLLQNPNNNNTNIANNNSMVSPFVTSSSNNIVPRPLKKYRKKEVINKLERRKRNLNSKPVDSLYNMNIDTQKCNSIILNPALEIKRTLNSNVDNNNNKVIVKKELEYITNYKDPVEITTN